MPDRDKPTVSEEMVEQLAELAEFELDPERRALITPQVDGLFSDAYKVNRFMDERREVGPAVLFDHPDMSDDDHSWRQS